MFKNHITRVTIDVERDKLSDKQNKKAGSEDWGYAEGLNAPLPFSVSVAQCCCHIVWVRLTDY